MYNNRVVIEDFPVAFLPVKTTFFKTFPLFSLLTATTAFYCTIDTEKNIIYYIYPTPFYTYWMEILFCYVCPIPFYLHWLQTRVIKIKTNKVP